MNKLNKYAKRVQKYEKQFGFDDPMDVDQEGPIDAIPSDLKNYVSPRHPYYDAIENNKKMREDGWQESSIQIERDGRNFTIVYVSQENTPDYDNEWRPKNIQELD